MPNVWLKFILVRPSCTGILRKDMFQVGFVHCQLFRRGLHAIGDLNHEPDSFSALQEQISRSLFDRIVFHGRLLQPSYCRFKLFGTRLTLGRQSPDFPRSLVERRFEIEWVQVRNQDLANVGSEDRSCQHFKILL